MEEKTSTQDHTGCIFCTVIGPNVEAFLDHVWPETTKEHFRNSRIEALKGIRSLLDARIDRLSRQAPKGTKVTVE